MKFYRYVVLIFTTLIFAFAAVACGVSSNTPTSSLQAACAAVKNKDVAAYKKTLSKSKLAGMDATAQQSNISTDELLKKYLDVINCPASPETGDEKIIDDKATLTLKNPTTGDVDKYNFVKEEGVWKLN